MHTHTHTNTQHVEQEVERAFKELVEENKGNEKYIMQLEMMKEDIFDSRLRARMSGALKSKVKESPFDAKLQVCLLSMRLSACVHACMYPKCTGLSSKYIPFSMSIYACVYVCVLRVVCLTLQCLRHAYANTSRNIQPRICMQLCVSTISTTSHSHSLSRSLDSSGGSLYK